METETFTEQGNPRNDASSLRNSRFTWCLGACFVLWVLSLLPCLIACLLFHHKQSPEPCWFHASLDAQEAPGSSQTAIRWTWTGNCHSSAMNKSESSLEILESRMYFTYINVACKEEGSFENYLFTVEMVATNSNKVLSVLKGPNGTRAFVSLARPYYLEKGTSLRLMINEGLKNIDINRTYWGLFKI